MKCTSHSIRAIVLLAGLAVCGSAIAEDKPNTKPAVSTTAKPVKRSGQPDALKKAIEELHKEAADATSKPELAFPRTTSDYFKSGLPTDVTDEDVLAVIEKSMSGSGVQVAYVKWQLLSGLPSKVDGPQVSRLMGAYRNAPQPVPGFGTDPKVKGQLDKMVMSIKEGQENELNDRVAKQREQIKAMNDVILGYREALYGRLPTSGDSLVARIYDGVGRAQIGIDNRTVLSGLSAEIRGWTAVDATPQQANAVLMTLKDVQKVKTPETYELVEFDDAKKPKWKKATYKFDAKACKPLEDMLKEYLANPGGSTLKFKK